MKKKRFKFFTFNDLQYRLNVLKKMKLISFFLLVGLMQAFAVPSNLLQQSDVTGKVVDNVGVPIPGVSIMIKGTTRGAITNADGIYELTGVNQNDVLIFSFVGMKTVEVAATSAVIDVTMEEEAIDILEVVAIGYGTVRKSDLTGSVGTVTSEELTSVPITTIEQGLQGRLAGVAITQNSSAPGGGISVKIRGNTSILNGSEPLYVIDGFPVTGQSQFNTSSGTGLVKSSSSGGEEEYTVALNPLSTINPSDIESIEVLKDASAAAIYGVRGANGVILITTKRGKKGAPTVSFDMYLGTQSVAKKIDMMNAQEYMGIWNAAENNAGHPDLFTGPAPYDMDWQDEVLRNAFMQNYQLGISGGTDAVQYSISGGYFDQQGIIKGSGFERASLRVNLDIQAGEKLKFGNSLNISRSKNNSAYTEGESRNGTMSVALEMSPILPVYQPNGDYSSNRHMAAYSVPDAQGNLNPVALVNEQSDQAINTRILGTVFGEYSIIDDLKFKVSLGADIESRDRHTYRTSEFVWDNPLARADVSGVQRSSLLNENTLNYDKTFGDHTISALAGFTVQKEKEEYRQIISQGMASDATTSYDLGGGSIPAQVASAYAEFSIVSLIGRINYNYASRYLLTATLRRDGSSKFAKGNEWANFPSVAAAWRINNESFMSNVSFISNLKLRAGYGTVGNQELPSYQSLALLQSANYNFGTGTVVSGFAPYRVAVPNLTWELTSQLNFGLDLSLLGNRVNLTADYYIKKTKDLLLNVILPETSGIREPSVQNLGEMENKGFEFSLDGIIISTADFSWRLGGNFSANKNEVTSLGEENIYGDLSFESSRASFAGGVLSSYITVGQPIGVFEGYETDGLYRTDDEAAAGQEAQPGVEAGMVRYVDVDGSGGPITAADRTELGSPWPDFIYGISTNLQYKNFELRAFFQGQKGGLVYNMMRRFNTSVTRGQNMLAERGDYWTPENTGAKWSKPTTVTPTVGGAGTLGESDWFLEDASYLRMREITLSYNLPQQFLGGIVGGSVYVTGQNLFTITKYTGYNPDTNGRSGSQGSFGYDVSSYPLAKAYILGVKLNF